jgi:hypothetical protein
VPATVVKPHSVKEHFTNKHPLVQATYEALVKAAERLGPVKQEAKKTSIHLVRKSAFAGIATRQSALILTLKLQTDLKNSRIIRRQQVSKSRWHLEIRLDSPNEVDAQLLKWLKTSYELSG